jgi:predicted HAD superfamily hydrolase
VDEYRWVFAFALKERVKEEYPHLLTENQPLFSQKNFGGRQIHVFPKKVKVQGTKVMNALII